MRGRLLFALCLCGLLLAGCRGPKEELPVLGRIGLFRLTDQSGKVVSSPALRGKVWVAAFMFTRCPTICPRITRRMQELQSAAKQASANVELVSISVDPEYDTPHVLQSYAREFDLDTQNWRFLTGDSQLIKKTALDSFKIAVEGKAESGAEHFGIVHGSHLVLVDSQLQIRGFYRSSDADVVSRLLRDIQGLNS